MTVKDKRNILLIGAAALFYIAVLGKKKFVTSYNDVRGAAADLIKGFELFRSRPYWDVSRYSWGYGTPAPGPSGSITQSQAEIELERFNVDNFQYLSRLITRPLTVNQWSALLSFAYNLGPGNADNLVTYINNGDYNTLGLKWILYANAGGVFNDDLYARRRKELNIFMS